MSPKGNADRARLWPALRALVEAALGAAEDHARALEAFVDAWLEAVTEGKPDPARHIAEFLFLHLAPQAGIYISHTVRQDRLQIGRASCRERGCKYGVIRGDDG